MSDTTQGPKLATVGPHSGPPTTQGHNDSQTGTQWNVAGQGTTGVKGGYANVPSQSGPPPPPPYSSHQNAGAPLRIENDSIQALYKSVKLVQKLRAAVSLTFQHLSEGVKRVTPNDPENESVSSSLSTENASFDQLTNTAIAIEDERQLLDELKKDLKKVGDTLGEVETQVNLIQDQSPQQHFARTPSFLLPLESVNVAEKHQLVTQLYHSHRWLDKLHEFAGVSSSLLSQNSTRRSASQSQGRDVGPLAAKRMKVKGPTSQQVSVAPAAIDQIVADLSRNFKNTMQIKLSRPLGNPALLSITLASTLKAYVILRGLIIEWVNIVGFGELQASDFDIGDSSQGSTLDTVWNKSKHQVFRRISEHAAAAMIHFYLPNNPELALRSFLMWLNSYEKLFHDPCYACTKIIQSSDGSVPVFRDLRTLKPYHDLCRP